jgi:hypothetical protein
MTLKSAILAAVTGEAAQETDPYYNLVSLHLKGDVNTGRSYNAFSDASTNNFRLTNNGDVRGSSFSPYGTSWSGFFDGSNDYVATPVTTNVDLGASNFTIEGWVYVSATANKCVLTISNAAAYPALMVQIGPTSAIFGSSTANSSWDVFYQSLTGLTNISNTWAHFAVSRSGNNFGFFINGVRVATATSAASIESGSNAAYIGVARDNNGFSDYFSGYISNVRLVKGSVVYDPTLTTLTVPTSPLTAIANTQLLLCQSGRFIDSDSPNTPRTGALALTLGDAPRISSFSPFLETDIITGSGYFDGTGDWLNCGSNAAFTVGTGAVTVEAWIYCTSLTNTYQGIMSGRADNSGTSWPGLGLTIDNSQLFFTIGASTSGLRDTSTVPLNQWVHVVGVRAGTNAALFVNGVRKASTTSSTVDGTTADMGIGRYYYGTDNYYFSGNISNARIVKGIAVYDPTQTSITVPSAPLTATQSAGTNIQAIPEFIYATFDSSASSVTLSNGNLTLTGVGGSGFNKANSTTAISSGKWYFEATLVSAGTDTSIGISQGNSSSSYPGQESTSYAYVLEKGQKFNNNSAAAYSSSLTTGDVFMCAVDLDNNKLFFGKNGTWLASSNPITGANPAFTLTAGTYRAVARPYSTNSATFNFGASTFAYTPPTGFTGLRSVPTSLLTLQERGAYNTIGFQDESEYQHQITRNGNVAQGTFSPFSNSGWGNYFDGSGDYLTWPPGSSVAFGTGDFTIEFWIYLQNDDSTAVILLDARNASQTTNWRLARDASTNKINFNNGSTPLLSNDVLLKNTGWRHIAVTRSGTNLQIFLDGVQTGTFTDNTNYNVSPTISYIGCIYTLSGFLLGYISNLRIIKGTALYTANFTPSTSPLTAITNTSLLTCQSNRFIDNSSNNFTITKNGDTRVVAFSPFKPVAYDASVHGASGYFDGNLDYIQSPTNPAFQMGTGDYTLECWAYFTATPPSTFAPLVDLRRASPNYVAPGLEVSNTLKLQLRDGSTGTTPLVGATTLTLNTWHHLAITRQSGTTRCFVNGVLDGTVTNTTNFNSTVGFTAGTSGDNVSGGYYFPGYLSSVRVLKGTALYTGNFTPPSGPLPLINNTSLLLNFTNGGVIDSTGKNVIETFGNAGVVTTTIKKYGSGSMFFDGTGDNLYLPSSRELTFGTGDFTIEGWAYFNSVSGGVLFDWRSDGTGFDVYLSTGTLNLSTSGTYYGGTSGITLVTGQWYHIAITRAGTAWRIYVNGTQYANITNSTNFTASILRIGFGAGNTYFNGNFDDIRITKGYARYVTGTGANANQMVFAGTNTLALPTKAFPDRGTASTLTSDLAAPSSVEALVVAGGGGGGYGGASGGGGGAGGFREFVGGSAIAVAGSTNYAISIGAGGVGGTSTVARSDGLPSTFGSVTAIGGGGGGGVASVVNSPGSNGGSGGGGQGNSGNSGAGGKGVYPGSTYLDATRQGYDGGAGATTFHGGGGGGAGGAGAAGSSAAGAGGVGAQSSITGIATFYAGGGGGGSGSGGGTAGNGGGGAGGAGDPSNGSAGTANTGGGGGGARGGTGVGGAGGSGVVIIAYPTSFRPLKASLGLVYTIDTVTRPGYRVYRFTSGTGSISW